MASQSQQQPPLNPAPSKRWTQFYAALQLAIQRAAHKWTFVFLLPSTLPHFLFHTPLALYSFSYKDFSECFPLWCEEQPSGAEGVFNTVSSFIETHIVVRPFVLSLSSHSFILTHFPGKTNTNKLYEQYDVPKNLDTLHQVVTEARARRQQQQRGESDATTTGGGKDIWRADLQPRVAVRAKTVPALEHERDLLRARLADVRIPSFPHPSLSPPVRTGAQACLNLKPTAEPFFSPFIILLFGSVLRKQHLDGEGEYGTLSGDTGKCGGTGPGGSQDC
jgi:hypothetical protein